MTKKLYSILGVEENASAKEIKAAYRSRSKVHHPDTGGDSETFNEIATAHAVLIDPVKRKRYDETGEYGRSMGDSFMDQFSQFVSEKLMPIIVGKNMDQLSIMNLQSEMMGEAVKFKDTWVEMKDGYEAAIERAKTALNRFEIHDKDKGDQLRDVLQGNIDQMTRDMKNLDEKINFTDKVIDIIDNYKYNTNREFVSAFEI